MLRRKILLVCLDGCGLDYIKHSRTPALDWIARNGFFVEGNSVVPSVTNVNNVSIITGSFPQSHGIVSNYWYNPNTGTGAYMESADLLLHTTVLQRAAAKGMSTALLTSKKKLLRLLDHGTGISFSAEDPPKELTDRLGDSGGIYSGHINIWLLKAAREILKTRDPDIAYVTTTDYVQHKYDPTEKAARQHIESMDEVIGEILDDHPDREIYVTADHGMNQMSQGVDLKWFLLEAGIQCEFVPIIKDKYIVHHSNLGGAAYLYLPDPRSLGPAMEVLQNLPEVEAVFEREEAVQEWHLHPDRIGDLFVLGTPGVVFGEFGKARVPIDVRSHGSRHESRVPIYGLNSPVPAERFEYNIDIVRNLGI